MSSDLADHSQQALVSYGLKTLIEQSVNDLECEVRHGWIGNEPFPAGKDKSIVTIEALSPSVDYAPAEIFSHTPPEPDDFPSVTATVVDDGSVRLPLRLNVWVVSRDRGKTIRDILVQRIRSLFDPLPGFAHGVTVHMEHLDAHAHLSFDGVETPDESTGIRRDEWRAIIDVQARYRSRHLRDMPFCREIRIAISPEGPFVSVAAVVESDG